MGYLGKQPTAVPLTSADITDGSISNVDIADLAASKLTGSIADARVPESAVTQHVTATDLTPVRQDINALALYNAVTDNRAAYNLPFSFIDHFQDDTGITTETDVDRDSSGEYVGTLAVGGVSEVGRAWDYSVGVDRGGGSPITTSMTFSMYGVHGQMVDGTVAGGVQHDGVVTDTSKYFQFDFNTSTYPAGVWITHFRIYNNESGTNNGAQYQFYGWNGSSWVTTNLGGSWTLTNHGMVGGAGGYTEYDDMVSNVANYTKYRMQLSGGATATASNWTQWSFYRGIKEEVGTLSATGTLISDTQTASVATTKMSGVILYKDNAGTATLGTDLVISLSANGGTNYTEAASYGAVTPVFSTGVKMVRLGETTVTSGTTPVMKAVWANQVASSKETQLHGWAMNY